MHKRWYSYVYLVSTCAFLTQHSCICILYYIYICSPRAESATFLFATLVAYGWSKGHLANGLQNAKHPTRKQRIAIMVRSCVCFCCKTHLANVLQNTKHPNPKAPSCKCFTKYQASKPESPILQMFDKIPSIKPESNASRACSSHACVEVNTSWKYFTKYKSITSDR